MVRSAGCWTRVGSNDIKEYAEKLREIEKFGLFPPSYIELMDPAGKAFNQDEQHDIFEGNANERITWRPGKKNRGYFGYDLINRALALQKFSTGEAIELRPGLTIMRGCGDNDLLAKQFKMARWKQNKGAAALEKDPPGEPVDKDRHLIDGISYIMLYEPDFIDETPRTSTFEPI